MNKTGIALAAAMVALTTVAAEPAAAATNLVTNGDFETGSLSPSWTVDTNQDTHITFDPLAAHGGNYYVDFGATTTALKGISQTINTVVNTTYTFSFYYAGDVGGSNEFQAYFGNTLAFDAVNTSTLGYVFKTFSYVAYAPQTVIKFLGRDDFSSLRVDDVSVVAQPAAVVPEGSTWVLMIAGAGCMGVTMRRRRGAAVAAA